MAWSIQIQSFRAYAIDAGLTTATICPQLSTVVILSDRVSCSGLFVAGINSGVEQIAFYSPCNGTDTGRFSQRLEKALPAEARYDKATWHLQHQISCSQAAIATLPSLQPRSGYSNQSIKYSITRSQRPNFPA